MYDLKHGLLSNSLCKTNHLIKCALRDRLMALWTKARQADGSVCADVDKNCMRGAKSGSGSCNVSRSSFIVSLFLCDTNAQCDVE